MADPLVLKTQQWLNSTYGNDSRYNVIEENGLTGWNTIYALTRALQIELGITNTSNNFGPTTTLMFNTRFPTGIHQQDDNDPTEDNIYAIIQGALFCKGYSTGVMNVTRHFYNGTGNAVKALRGDAGIDNTVSTVTLNIMKSLLSMDAFKLLSYGDTYVRTMQQYLNANYEAYIGIKPCDGVYGRETNKALILAIQAEEGMPTNVANGNVGPTTKKCLPPIPYTGGYIRDGQTWGVNYSGNTYSSSEIEKFIILANMALYFNGIGNGSISSTLNSTFIQAFQSDYAIPTTGNIDYTTWLSLITSAGDSDRTAIACDTATIITTDNVSLLTQNNYQYIGRYLSGTVGGNTSKALTTDELQLLFSNNIRIFPIFQEGGTSSSYFTTSQAVTDATKAATALENLKIQYGAIIYFAVDFDSTDAQITNLVLPYFQTLRSNFIKNTKGKYRIGVYGTRNLCKRVCNAGYACSSFVSDMSTGYSGNLGFSIPGNWAFDQFATITLSSGNESLEIDKDGFSGNYLGISQEYSVPDVWNIHNTTSNSFLLVNRSSVACPVYSTKKHIDYPEPTFGTQYDVDGDIIGYIYPNDFYLFFGVSNLNSNTVHKVLFNDGTDLKMGYIDGQHVYPGNNQNYNQGNYNQRPLYHEPYSCLRYNPTTNTYNLEAQNTNHEIFINKPVYYFDTSGNYLGTLHNGDVITITGANSNNTGNSMPWCYRVNKIEFANGDEYNSACYVSTGLEYGSSGTSRAWY